MSVRRADEGFILVVVLVLLMALATLASAYSVYAGNTAAETLVPEDRLVGEAAARAAVELAALQVLAAPETQRPRRGHLAARLANARIEARYLTEAARIDLNAAPKELLSGLFASLGAPKELADRYADGVIAWRTKSDPNAPEADPPEYKAAGLDYGPRRGLFDSMAELGLVAGLPHAIVDRAQSFVTIYSGRPEIDVADAAAETIAALPELDPDAVAAFLKARAGGADDAALLALLGAAKVRATAESGAAYRVDVVVALRQRQMRAEIVFKLKTEGDVPFDILYWRDDFDAPMPGV